MSPCGQTSRVFRVSGREGELKRSLRTLLNLFLTSRDSTGPSRGKGWGKRSAEGKGPENTEGTKPTPRRALSRLRPEGGCGRWENVKSTESSRWRVRATSPLGPLQGAWSSVTSAPEPRASRRKAKAGPSVQELCDTPAPVARGGNSSPTLRSARAPPPISMAVVATGASTQGRVAPPAGTRACHRSPLCHWLPLQEFRLVGRRRVRYPALSIQPPPREVLHPRAQPWPRRCGRHAGGSPRRRGSQALLGPRCCCDGMWVFPHSTSFYLFSSY